MCNRVLTSLQRTLLAAIDSPFQPTMHTINGTQYPIMHIDLPFDMEGDLKSLSALPLFPKIYWECPKEQRSIITFGAAHELTTLPQIDSTSPLRFFGGQDFNPRHSDLWQGIPPCYYVLPLIELEQRACKTLLRINRICHFPHIPTLPSYRDSITHSPMQRKDYPSFNQWKQHIHDILSLIHTSDLRKVVLARHTQFDFPKNLHPFTVLNTLKAQTGHNTRFVFQFTPTLSFIGSSPETLYYRRKRQIMSEAIAGTRPKGHTAQETTHFTRDLLSSLKDREEFNFVKEEIESLLLPLCRDIKTSHLNVLHTPTLQHLHQTIEGTLHPLIDDKTLIHTLHPTPAIGGVPRSRALQEIHNREPFDRGWYSAPIGWISATESHQLVAIRSTLIKKNQLHLFAGTGIVKGSDPLEEWRELEAKIAHYGISQWTLNNA